MQKLEFKFLNQALSYSGFFKLSRYQLQHRRYDGTWSQPLARELFERGHAAAILPYDPIADKIILIEQFRIGAIHSGNSAWLTEIVAGIIEPGETPEQVVHREALEEAGCQIIDMEKIYTCFVSPGGTSETITLYCGCVDATDIGGIHGCSEEGEDIRVFTCPFSEALTMVENGQINSASPIMAIQWLSLNRERLRLMWKKLR